MDLKKIKILSFDCYGTLIDWEKGISDVLMPWSKENDLNLDEETLLEHFAKVETVIQQEHPDWKYPMVLKEVANRLSERLGVRSTDQFQSKLATSVGHWPAFPDTVPALKILEQHFKLVILSNISQESFRSTNENSLGMDFYKVLTAEQIGSYKPDLNNFNYMIHHLREEGIQKEEILHVAQSLYHDMVPATQLGLSTVWINRRKDRRGYGATPPPNGALTLDLEFNTLGDFASYISKEGR